MSILKLKVTSYHRLTPGQVVEQTFTEQGASIGRSAKSDWLLPDPDKVISSVHAYVSHQAGQFYITDNSTNGLFVNRAVQPLGKGNSQELSDGDYLQLGDYEIEVVVEAKSNEIDLQPSRQAQHLHTPPPVRPAAAAPDFAAQTTVDSQQAQPSHAETLSQDPYAENFTPPMAQIPEDWDAQAGANSELNTPMEDQQSVPSAVQQHNTADTTKQAVTEASSPEQTRVAAPTAPVQSATQGASAESVVATQQQPDAYGARSHSQQTPQHPPPNAAASFDSIGSEQAKAYLTAFLNAAGLREDDLPREISPALFEAMGGALRFSLQGMLDILRARSDMKSEFRVMQTTIRTQENNPLKFSINVDEAMRNLFLRQVPGFLPWFQAIESCFKDMSTHELALMAGTQGALQGVLDTLDPSEITRANQSESALHKVLPATKKAKLWDVFAALHKEVQEEVGQGSDKTFSEDFAAAYEAQLKKLGAN
ncbi:type VI secretion system-associated FHA domain protein TagH [Kangiella marina]|uniref:Type VI secretion system-associated FHA domain protein TagH n=1 Tax=Kangiella marina TaxID=1079178 RepID=A0ABP8IJ49_9GAMM